MVVAMSCVGYMNIALAKYQTRRSAISGSVVDCFYTDYWTILIISAQFNLKNSFIAEILLSIS